jgi:hypothetical protein
MHADGDEPVPHEPPSGCSWERYIETLSVVHGGKRALVDLLLHRGKGTVDLPQDPFTIERGLRRLATRGHASGGKYGRWLLRFFGVPEPLSLLARWMGQYHSRFSDLPLELRASQLNLWDRPPMCESSVAAWIHLGLASIAMRRRDRDEAEARLARAARGAPAAGPAALVEMELLRARLLTDRGGVGADDALDRAAASLDAISDRDEVECYAARLADQRAYRLLHPRGERPVDVVAAQAIYAAIEANSSQPFVRFRRDHGLAYCAYKLGDHGLARQHAHGAIDHAGDGGLLRCRVMALDLLAHVVGGAEATVLRSRAERIRAALGQEDLLARLPSADAVRATSPRDGATRAAPSGPS